MVVVIIAFAGYMPASAYPPDSPRAEFDYRACSRALVDDGCAKIYREAAFNLEGGEFTQQGGSRMNWWRCSFENHLCSTVLTRPSRKLRNSPSRSAADGGRLLLYLSSYKATYKEKTEGGWEERQMV